MTNIQHSALPNIPGLSEYHQTRLLCESLLHERQSEAYDIIFEFLKKVACILKKQITCISDFKYIYLNVFSENISRLKQLFIDNQTFFDDFNIIIKFPNKNCENYIIKIISQLLKKTGFLLKKTESYVYVKHIK